MRVELRRWSRWVVPWMTLWAAGCGQEALDYARPDQSAVQATISARDCPGCAAWRCERHVLEAYEAGSEAEEAEIFHSYLQCLRDAGVQDPCIEHIPLSALFEERYAPSDWYGYEGCLRAHEPVQPGSRHTHCGGLLGQAQRSPNEATRYWFLTNYEACVRGIEDP